MVLNYNRVPSMDFLEYEALTCHCETSVHTAKQFSVAEGNFEGCCCGDCGPGDTAAE